MGISKTKWVLAAVAGVSAGGYFMTPSDAPAHAVTQTACDEDFIRSQTPVQKITNEQKQQGLLIEGKFEQKTVCRVFIEGATGRNITWDQQPNPGQKDKKTEADKWRADEMAFCDGPKTKFKDDCRTRIEAKYQEKIALTK